MIIPDQAAILCGGLGSRLRPITDKTPKPMVPVNGVPFLEHLICQLKENGIFKFVLMTGYLGDQIQDYFGNSKVMISQAEHHFANPISSKYHLLGDNRVSGIKKDIMVWEELENHTLDHYISSFLAL